MDKRKISVPSYKEGILDVCDFIRIDLINFLGEEGRYHGRMISYMKELQNASASMNKSVSEEDMDLYGRILWVVRSQIYSDFKYLRRKRLSCADCCICIIKKLVDVIFTVFPEDTFRFKGEASTYRRVIGKIYDNIRKSEKEYKFPDLKEILERAIYSGWYGDVPLDTMDLSSVARPPKKVKASKPSRIIMESSSKKQEISL